jgi:hypothetical protein
LQTQVVVVGTQCTEGYSTECYQQDMSLKTAFPDSIEVGMSRSRFIGVLSSVRFFCAIQVAQRCPFQQVLELSYK